MPYAGGRPYGDIYSVSTKAVDNIANRLIREQQMREQMQQQELKALDGVFGQNTSKMRDIDIPTFTNKVQAWKQSAINLLKRPPKNQQEYIQQQLDVQRKLGDAQSHLGRSVKEKEDEESELKQVRKDPYSYKENAREFIAARRVTPLEQFQQTTIGEDGKPVVIDMSDLYGNIADDGRGTDFNPAWSKAQGKFEVRGTPVDEISPDKLTTTTTTYKGINSPSQMISSLANAVTGERATNHFIRQHSYTDQEAEQILSSYEKLKNSPEFKNAYPNEPEMPATMFLSPLGKAKALSVMQRHLENPPVTVKGSPKQNIGAVMDRRMNEWAGKKELSFDYWLKQNGITSAQKDRRMSLTKNNQTYEIDDVPKLLSNYVVVEEKTWAGEPENRIYLDNVPVSYKSDLLGKNTALITADNKQYVKVNPDGSYQSKTGIILPKDVYLNTIKRSTPWEKPKGTEKVDVRNNSVQPPKKGNPAPNKPKGEADDL